MSLSPHEALSNTQGTINRDEEGDAATFGTVGHDTNGLPFGINQDAARIAEGYRGIGLLERVPR